jgi:hypothetical protein
MEEELNKDVACHQYADELVLLAKEETVLQTVIDRLIESGI